MQTSSVCDLYGMYHTCCEEEGDIGDKLLGAQLAAKAWIVKLDEGAADAVLELSVLALQQPASTQHAPKCWCCIQKVSSLRLQPQLLAV